MSPNEIVKVQAYLQQTFNNNMLKLMKRPKATDSLEVMLDDEFIGIVYRDEDEGEVSYQFHMTILEEDLSQE
jgi:hypothetical protein